MATTSELDHFLCPQALQDEAESREGSWEKLREVIGRLEDSCPPIAGIMKEKCQDAHSRYAQKDQPAVLTLGLLKASHSSKMAGVICGSALEGVVHRVRFSVMRAVACLIQPLDN